MIIAHEYIDAAISKTITDLTTISALKNKLIKEKSTELPKPTACEVISASMKNLSH